MKLILCVICLKSADQTRLKLRNMTAFYALNPSAFEDVKDSHAWLCAFCWKRVSQCIHFIDMAKRSKHVLKEFPSESLLAGLKPTDLHPYKVRLLPHLEIANGPAETKRNHPAPSTESESRSVSRFSLDTETEARQLLVVSQPVLPVCQPVLPINQPVLSCQSALPNCQPDPNVPTSSGINTNAKPVLVYTTTGYKIVNDPYTLMKVKQECAEILTENEVKRETLFVKMEVEVNEQELKEESIELEPSPALDVPIVDAAKLTDPPVQNDVVITDYTPMLNCVEMSEEDMSLGRDESRKKKRFINRQYKCENCIIGFLSEDKYRQHLMLHDEDCGSFECPICLLRFPTLFEQQNHTKRHYMTNECRECGLRGANRKAMRHHYEESHQDEVYNCGLCDRRFRSRRMWRNHIETVHYNFTECNVCGKVLSNMAKLKHHMRMHDDTSRSECPICHKTFRQLKSHMLNHNTDIDPNAYCAECDLRFKNIYVYRNHLKQSRKHASPGFQCAHCDRKFNSKSVLKSHLFTIHFKTLVFCPHCNKDVVGAQGLRAHIRKAHDAKVKDKVCNVCGTGFVANRCLKNHMRRHTGERPFECQTCGDKFGYKAALYTHNRLKHLKLKRKEKKSTKRT